MPCSNDVISFCLGIIACSTLILVTRIIKSYNTETNLVPVLPIHNVVAANDYSVIDVK